ncbi:MAG: tRNA threonylcarbamoyladenosine dehydratase [Clostridiales bacterium]|nr:tRNA threonylcarbamoyladenosine dehydratase [Clostridiales bacterium]
MDRERDRPESPEALARRTARTALLMDEAQLGRLRDAHVMLFGLGGVGSYTAEALARVGIGRLTLVDADVVVESNINRQLCALTSTLGQSKARVTRERLLDINPSARITAIEAFHLPDAPVSIPADVDVVVDAIDTVAAKIDLAVTCAAGNLPIISCMGMGNRYDPTRIRIGDLFETAGCPLCRVMRKELRKRGLNRLRCVYSDEPACACAAGEETKAGGRQAPGSLPYVPSVAGLYLAFEAVAALLNRG